MICSPWYTKSKGAKGAVFFLSPLHLIGSYVARTVIATFLRLEAEIPNVCVVVVNVWDSLGHIFELGRHHHVPGTRREVFFTVTLST